jgi:hypothetical protein
VKYDPARYNEWRFAGFRVGCGMKKYLPNLDLGFAGIPGSIGSENAEKF